MWLVAFKMKQLFCHAKVRLPHYIIYWCAVLSHQSRMAHYIYNPVATSRSETYNCGVVVDPHPGTQINVGMWKWHMQLIPKVNDVGALLNLVANYMCRDLNFKIQQSRDPHQHQLHLFLIQCLNFRGIIPT